MSLFRSFNKIKKSKILVVGDFVLDTYTMGRAKRISPEAPVAVLQVEREVVRPGMAGNVALNLLSLGADVIAVGRVGDDESGKMLLETLLKEGVDTSGIFLDPGFLTPVKNRIIAANQQIVRVDREQISSLCESLEEKMIAAIPTLLKGTQLIAVSDYGKGVVTDRLMKSLVLFAKENNILLVVDPKGVDYGKYVGVDLIKPNTHELYAAAGLDESELIDFAAERVLRKTKASLLMVTRSELGISLFNQDGKRQDFPVRVQEVKDVTGAGDTVLAMLSCALASGLMPSELAMLSNIAAGIAIGRFGCARVQLSEIARNLLSDHFQNKVFDEEHLFVLQQALKERRFVTVPLSCEKQFTLETLSFIKQLAEKDNCDVLVHIKDETPNETYMDMLASLPAINYIVHAPNVENLTEVLTNSKQLQESVFAFENNPGSR